MPAKLTLNQVIEKFKLKHNNKYSYEKITEYINAKTPVTIICPKQTTKNASKISWGEAGDTQNPKLIWGK